MQSEPEPEPEPDLEPTTTGTGTAIGTSALEPDLGAHPNDALHAAIESIAASSVAGMHASVSAFRHLLSGLAAAGSTVGQLNLSHPVYKTPLIHAVLRNADEESSGARSLVGRPGSGTHSCLDSLYRQLPARF